MLYDEITVGDTYRFKTVSELIRDFGNPGDDPTDMRYLSKLDIPAGFTQGMICLCNQLLIIKDKYFIDIDGEEESEITARIEVEFLDQEINEQAEEWVFSPAMIAESIGKEFEIINSNYYLNRLIQEENKEDIYETIT